MVPLKKKVVVLKRINKSLTLGNVGLLLRKRESK